MNKLLFCDCQELDVVRFRPAGSFADACDYLVLRNTWHHRQHNAWNLTLKNLASINPDSEVELIGMVSLQDCMFNYPITYPCNRS